MTSRPGHRCGETSTVRASESGWTRAAKRFNLRSMGPFRRPGCYPAGPHVVGCSDGTTQGRGGRQVRQSLRGHLDRAPVLEILHGRAQSLTVERAGEDSDGVEFTFSAERTSLKVTRSSDSVVTPTAGPCAPPRWAYLDRRVPRRRGPRIPLRLDDALPRFARARRPSQAIQRLEHFIDGRLNARRLQTEFDELGSEI